MERSRQRAGDEEDLGKTAMILCAIAAKTQL